jgi:hypothetical protein
MELPQAPGFLQFSRLQPDYPEMDRLYQKQSQKRRVRRFANAGLSQSRRTVYVWGKFVSVHLGSFLANSHLMHTNGRSFDKARIRRSLLLRAGYLSNHWWKKQFLVCHYFSHNWKEEGFRETGVNSVDKGRGTHKIQGGHLSKWDNTLILIKVIRNL